MKTSSMRTRIGMSAVAALMSSGLVFGVGAAPSLAEPTSSPTASATSVPTPPETVSGDHTTECMVNWSAISLNNAAYEDYSNNGYLQKVKKALYPENWGRFEAEHWLTASKLFWRVPLAVDHDVKNATVRIVFTDPQWTPDEASFTNFPQAQEGAEDYFTRFTEERDANGAPRYQRAMQEDALSPQWTDDAEGHRVLTLQLGELKAGTWVMFQFTGVPTTEGESPMSAHKDYRLQVDFSGELTPGAGSCPAETTPEPTPEPTASMPPMSPTPTSTVDVPNVSVTPMPSASSTVPVGGNTPSLPDTGGSTAAFTFMGLSALVTLSAAGALTVVNRRRERREQ